MRKISNSSSPDFFQAQNAPKSVFGRGSAPDPAGGAYDAPPDPLVVRGRGMGTEYPPPTGGYSVPIPLPLDAFASRNSAATAPRFSGPLNTNFYLRQWLGADLYQKSLFLVTLCTKQRKAAADF